MKSLPLQSQHYRYLLQSYKEYLQVTGYAETTWQSWPVHVREFLHYIESKKIEHITAIETNHINDFIQHIKRRKNQTTAGALSSSSINKIINGVNVFAKFLNSTGSYFFELTAQRAETDVAERNILTIAEIKQLYEASYLPYEWNNAAMGQRDRAIIALYYGCGLRRSEGVQLKIGRAHV